MEINRLRQCFLSNGYPLHIFEVKVKRFLSNKFRLGNIKGRWKEGVLLCNLTLSGKLQSFYQKEFASNVSKTFPAIIFHDYIYKYLYNCFFFKIHRQNLRTFVLECCCCFIFSPGCESGMWGQFIEILVSGCLSTKVLVQTREAINNSQFFNHQERFQKLRSSNQEVQFLRVQDS